MKNVLPSLTKKENEIMKILWDSEKPLMSSEITVLANVAEKSCLPMINTLLKKGYLKVVGNLKMGKTVNRLYVASISLSEYTAMQLNTIYAANNKKIDISSMLSYLVKGIEKRDEAALIKDLKDMIEKYESDN